MSRFPSVSSTSWSLFCSKCLNGTCVEWREISYILLHSTTYSPLGKEYKNQHCEENRWSLFGFLPPPPHPPPFSVFFYSFADQNLIIRIQLRGSKNAITGFRILYPEITTCKQNFLFVFPCNH